ncbi:MAG: TetR/AcrR family transcriptional regulator [Hyphomicrobiales bacterium]
MGRTTKRDIILDTAETLFEKQGYAATGINQITKEADVAAMTLYNNFINKDALILAVLERRSKSFFKSLELQADEEKTAPHKRIFTIFDKYDVWLEREFHKSDDFTGCIFVKASVEFSKPQHPAHRFSNDHKQSIIQLFKDDLIELNCPDVNEMALSLHLLLEGALVQTHLLSDSNCVKRARKMAEKQLEAYS